MITVKIATVVVQRRSSGITTLSVDALWLETELLTLINTYRMQQGRSHMPRVATAKR